MQVNIVHRLKALFRRNATVSAVVVLTIAAGVTATLTTASVTTALLFQPLSFEHGNSLVALHGISADRPGNERGFVNPADFMDWEQRVRGFAAIAAYNSYEGAFQRDGDAIRVSVATVTRGMSDVLQLRPALGRMLMPDDYVGTLTAVLVSHRFWRNQLGGDSSIINASVMVNGRARTVVGVLPEMHPEFPGRFELWAPMRINAAAQRSATFLTVVGRLRDGTSEQAAQAEMNQISGELASAYPATNANRRVLVKGLRESIAGPVTPMLVLICGVIGVLLLVVCANAGILLVSAAHARRREFAVRRALGVSTRRLAASLIGETAMLAILGASIGMVAAPLAIRALVRSYPGELPRADEIAVTPIALAITLVMILLTIVVASLPSIRRAHRIDLTRDLASGSRSTAKEGFATSTLVVAQVALTITLMFGGSLMLKAFLALSSTPAGFRSDNLLTFNLATPPATYATLDQYRALYDPLYERIRSLPGVVAVGGSNLLPFAPGNLDEYIIREEVPDDRANLLGSTQWVTPGYLQALDLPLVRGRLLDATDIDTLAPSIVVNATFAANAYPNQDAIGKRLRFRNRAWTIVGIVGDKRHASLGAAPKGEIFIPRAANQYEMYSTWVAIRTTGDPATLIPAIRDIVRSLDRTLPVADIATMESRLSASMAAERFRAFLVGALGVTALLLALAGVYGVVADRIGRQVKEIGIRIALGARARHIATVAMNHVLALVVIGLVAGAGLSIVGARVLASVFGGGLTANIPLLALVGATFVVAALLAASVPLRRALRVSPLSVIRD